MLQLGSANTLESLFLQAGVEIGGTDPWDIQVHDERFYDKVLAQGSLGMGEAYMAGWWDCEELDLCMAKIMTARLHRKALNSVSMTLASIEARIRNKQTKADAFSAVARHYETGNDLYKAMLCKNMIYTCAYWKDAWDLDSAQEAKLKLVCDKAKLEPGMRVLDIGCGWGGLARFAAENYGVEVVGLTVSQNQAEWAREKCRGLPVKIKLQDYRDEYGIYDRVVSLGMLEHVGYKNYGEYMRMAHRCLEEEGLFVLQTIGNNRSVHQNNPWLDKYIFPNSVLPSAAQLTEASEGLFILEDWHNFGSDYDRTLMAWHANFLRNWPRLKARYDETFFRMWRLYLLGCAASFRVRNVQLWQIVLAKNPREQYFPVR